MYPKTQNRTKKKKRRSSGRRRKARVRHVLNKVVTYVTPFPFRPKHIFAKPGTHLVGYCYRSSTRWLPTEFRMINFDGMAGLPIYYVEDQGVKTDIRMYTISCDIRSIISSFFSTCYRRFVGSLRKRFSDSWIHERLDLVAAIVAYYTVQQDHSMFRRMYSCLIHSRHDDARKLVQAVIYRRLETDGNTRFVFATIWKQVLWFTFRSKLPKSAVYSEKRVFSIFNGKFLADERVDKSISALFHILNLVATRICSPGQSIRA